LIPKKSILVLAETIDEEGSSAGKANNSFVKALYQSGFIVKIYHFSHLLVNISKMETILISEKKTDINYILSRTQRVFQRFTGRNWSKTLENWFGFSFTFKNDLNSMVSALRKEKPVDYDLIITLSKGASYRTHGALLKLPEWHGKWLAYVHDPYPFHWYPPPYKWFEAGYKQKERFFVTVAEKAEWLGYPSQLLADWMGQFRNSFKEKSVILPHQILDYKTNSENLPDYFKTGKFTVLHAGNLLGQRDPFPLLAAWQVFIQQNPGAVQDAQLLLLGPAAHHEPELSKFCAPLTNVYKSDGYVNHREVKAMEHAASVNIVLEAVSEVSPFLPAKFPGLVRANRKILHLGPKNSESRRLLGENHHFAAEADNVEKIAELLGELFNIWKENPEQLKLNRTDLEAYFSPETLGQHIEKLLNRKTS
jgi:hypothetical protein